jgi:hypothetical protein
MPIIRAMNEGRQLTVRAIFSMVCVLGVLIGTTACEARSTLDAAQTMVRAAQTALPGAQATALAAATQVSSAMPALETLLAGANVSVDVSPEGAPPDEATDVSVRATDSSGALARLDARGRQAAISGALVLAANYYPNATISVAVVDGSGVPLASGTKAPGQAPRAQ